MIQAHKKQPIAASVHARLAQDSDIPALYDFLKYRAQENGKDGDIIFSPSDEPWDEPFDTFEKSSKEQWAKPVTETGWARMWIAMDGDKVCGELKVRQLIPLKSCLHRAILSMHIGPGYRGQGVGSLLMTEAVNWAKAQPTLDWLQLYVFAHNMPARKLYKKFGFKETGLTEDMFRLHGQSITDIEMTLKLK